MLLPPVRQVDNAPLVRKRYQGQEEFYAFCRILAMASTRSGSTIWQMRLLRLNGLNTKNGLKNMALKR